MNVWLTENGWACDDFMWFLRNFKVIYHLTCMFEDGAE